MKILKSQILTVTAISVMLLLGACTAKNESDSKELAEDQNEQKFNDSKIEDDSEFAVAAADGGLLEVQLGKLAQTISNTSDVKILGQMMADEHGKSNQELKELAAQKNITLPTVLSDKNQKKYNDLASKTGKDFDDAYTDFMVKDHQEDIDEFKKQADNGNDMELKSWAAGKVSSLEHHLEMAKQAEEAVNKLK
jgi:putative membrane protein